MPPYAGAWNHGEYIIVPKNPIKVLPPKLGPDSIIFGPNGLKPELEVLVVLVLRGFAEVVWV
jgi:hypothetical protein